MDTPARLRLYQYSYSPYCIPIALALRHSGLPFEVVELPAGDPRTIIELTKAAYYQVPVLEDIFTHQVIFDTNPDGMDVPRYIDHLAPLMRLFPAEVDGLHKILLFYIEDECESYSFKVCDANRDKWLKTDVARGLHRRHKERKFGVGCLDAWLRDIDQLIAGFHRRIQPFEQMLADRAFLTGARPVYADYALCGVIGNFLFPGNTTLPENCLMLEAWYTRMCAGNFKTTLDEVQLASAEQFSGRADQYGKSHILADTADVELALADLKMRPNTPALDIATGNGHTAILLAKKGYVVTASDVSTGMLDQARKLAAEQAVTIDLREHTAEKLPYPDNSFGLVTCRVAAHHFSSPESFIRESARVLKMYGHLVIIDTTVPDDHVEAATWIDTVDRLRDPSHMRYVSPNSWRKWCADSGLTVSKVLIEPFKMPDLNWYFTVANTPPENRKKVLEMIARAPAGVRELFKLGQEDGKIVWYWRRLTLVAGKM